MTACEFCSDAAHAGPCFGDDRCMDRCRPTFDFPSHTCSRRATRTVSIAWPDQPPQSFELCWQHDRAVSDWISHLWRIAPGYQPVRVSADQP